MTHAIALVRIPRQRSARTARAVKGATSAFHLSHPRQCGFAFAAPPPLSPWGSAKEPVAKGASRRGATMAREKWISALPKRGQRQRCSGGALKSLELHCSRPGSQSSTDLHVCEFRCVPARKNQRIPCLGPQRMIYRGATLRHFFVSRKLRRCRFHIASTQED